MKIATAEQNNGQERKKMKTIYKGLLIERNQSGNLLFSRISIKRKSALKELYNALQCDNIEIQERYINNKIYDFIFDGEYMINNKTESAENIRAFSLYNNEIIELIYGNLFICGVADSNGEETDLKESDINNILKAITFIKHEPTNKSYQVLKYDIERTTKK